jgi:hypothetical protein
MEASIRKAILNRLKEADTYPDPDLKDHILGAILNLKSTGDIVRFYDLLIESSLRNHISITGNSSTVTYAAGGGGSKSGKTFDLLKDTEESVKGNIRSRLRRMKGSVSPKTIAKWRLVLKDVSTSEHIESGLYPFLRK